MPTQLAKGDQMTIEEFLAFRESRPDGGRWELIEGVAFTSPSPTDWHQIVVTNIVTWLVNHKVASKANWYPLIGVGTVIPVAPNSLPQPDALVKETPGKGSHVTHDALVLFEVLSKSNTKADQAWRKRMYTSIVNCQHHVTVSMQSAEVTRFDRADGWAGAVSIGLTAQLVLPAVNAKMPLGDIYRWTPIE